MEYYRSLGEKVHAAVRALTGNTNQDNRFHEAGMELVSLSVKNELERSEKWNLSSDLKTLSKEINERYQEIMKVLCDETKPGGEGHIWNSIRSMDSFEKSALIGDILTLSSRVDIFNYLWRQRSSSPR